MNFSPAALLPIALLIVSNIFMSFAWYAHLKHKDWPLLAAIFISWGIALFKYMLVIPANRLGSQVYSTAQLKTLQEVITLIVFALFSWLYLGERLSWNHAVGFAFIMIGAWFVFKKW